MAGLDTLQHVGWVDRYGWLHPDNFHDNGDLDTNCNGPCKPVYIIDAICECGHPCRAECPDYLLENIMNVERRIKEVPAEVRVMDAAIHNLALELPDTVYEDVKAKWLAVRDLHAPEG